MMIEKYRITIDYDEDPMNPREWDNLTTMVCCHGSYKLGDEQRTTPPSEDEILEDYDVVEVAGRPVIKPLYLYDHDGISLSTTISVGWLHHGEWDSGQVGWVFVERKGQELCGTADANLLRVLEAEVEEYDRYMRGDRYEFRVDRLESCACGEHSDWEYVVSCGGFHSVEDCLEEAKHEIPEGAEFLVVDNT